MVPLSGSYNITNALIAYTVGRFFGLSILEIRQGFAYISITQNRTEWLAAGNGAAILSDVYDTDPTAMGLVLGTFKNLPIKGRRTTVLTDILKLEKDSLDMHVQVSEHTDPEKLIMIFLYGEQTCTLKEDLS